MVNNLPYVSTDVPRGGLISGFFSGGAKGGLVGALATGGTWALSAATTVLFPTLVFGLLVPGVTVLGSLAAVASFAAGFGLLAGATGAIIGGTLGTPIGSVIGAFSGHGDRERAERIQQANQRVIADIAQSQQLQGRRQQEIVAALPTVPLAIVPSVAAPYGHADRLLASGYQPVVEGVSHTDNVVQRQQAPVSQSQIQ